MAECKKVPKFVGFAIPLFWREVLVWVALPDGKGYLANGRCGVFKIEPPVKIPCSWSAYNPRFLSERWFISYTPFVENYRGQKLWSWRTTAVTLDMAKWLSERHHQMMGAEYFHRRVRRLRRSQSLQVAKLRLVVQ